MSKYCHLPICNYFQIILISPFWSIEFENQLLSYVCELFVTIDDTFEQ